MQNRLNIIDALEAARKAQGLTQAELATRSGTTRVTVGRIESGHDPKLSTVYEMARALGLELMLVPKSLTGEVQSFLRSGGRSLAQPVGASAPPSVVDLAGRSTAKMLATGVLSVAKATSLTPKFQPGQVGEVVRHTSTGGITAQELAAKGLPGVTISPEAAKALGMPMVITGRGTDDKKGEE